MKPYTPPLTEQLATLRARHSEFLLTELNRAAWDVMMREMLDSEEMGEVQ